MNVTQYLMNYSHYVPITLLYSHMLYMGLMAWYDSGDTVQYAFNTATKHARDKYKYTYFFGLAIWCRM